MYTWDENKQHACVMFYEVCLFEGDICNLGRQLSSLGMKGAKIWRIGVSTLISQFSRNILLQERGAMFIRGQFGWRMQIK